MNQRSAAIGLDVGGTKIAGGIVDLQKGWVLRRRTIATQAERGGAAVLENALQLAEQLQTDAHELDIPVHAIGVGICELVDPDGTVTSGYAVDWRGMPVQERFAQIAPARVEADVRAHALAEAQFGAGRQFRVFAFVTIGTGISSCLVQDGQPFTGARGNALILASSPLTHTCSVCGTTDRLILEEFASGPALVRRYNQAAGTHYTRGEEVLAAAAHGDQQAVDIVLSAGMAVGVSIGWLANVLDPEAVILGGGLGMADGLYRDCLLQSTREHIWSPATRDLPIIAAELGTDAGFIGAALAAAKGAHA